MCTFTIYTVIESEERPRWVHAWKQQSRGRSHSGTNLVLWNVCRGANVVDVALHDVIGEVAHVCVVRWLVGDWHLISCTSVYRADVRPQSDKAR